MPTPNLEAVPGKGALFLDKDGVARADNVIWSVEVTQKHPRNPVLRPTFKPGTPDEGGVMNHGTVRLENGRFRMWYAGWEIPGHGPMPEGENWDRYMNICYAESDDGIDWERPKLGLVDYMGRKDNNVVPNLWLFPTLCRDDCEPDPQRRYKCVEQVKPDRLHPERGHLHTSPDGIHWLTEEAPRAFPGARPWYFNWDSVFRDDQDQSPDRRWKAYGSYGPSAYERSAGVAFSPDGIHWTGYPLNPILGPATGVKPYCHDLVVWLEKGLYVGLLQTADTNKNYEFELVVSRDGIRFDRVADGQSFIARGSDHDWDLGLITLFSSPVFVGDETWFYYGSVARAHEKYDVKKVQAEWTSNPCSGGVARVRTGRYAAFNAVARGVPGSLLTVPVEFPANTRLVLCLNALSDETDSIRVEVRDAATGRPLPGHALTECEPIRADGISLPVRWKEKDAIASTPKSVRLRFELRGAAELYGFEWSMAQ